MKRIKTKTISDLMDNTQETIRNWIKSKRPIISFLNKYFTNDDIIEYIETNKISRIEALLEYEEICSCIKKELTLKCQELKKNKNQSFIDFGLYLKSLDMKQCIIDVGPIRLYNSYLFDQLLVDFNGYLMKTKNKNFIKILAEVESFYNSLSGNVYKYYFHKEMMWIFTQEKQK